MDRLVRIKSVDKFRFFKDYRWNNALKPFGKYNLIYGWNGCGKSTLSDFFYSLEIGAPLPAQCAFQLCFQEECSPENIVTAGTIQTIAKRFKVYHQHYAQNIISTPNRVKHISIIGYDEGQAATRIEELKTEQIKWEGQLTAIKAAEGSITSQFEAYRRERAGLV